LVGHLIRHRPCSQGWEGREFESLAAHHPGLPDYSAPVIRAM